MTEQYRQRPVDSRMIRLIERQIPVSDSVDRLPSFITGPQPQVNGAVGFEPNGGERFPPRRRRRPHGPRPEGIAAPVTPSDDFNPGNE